MKGLSIAPNIIRKTIHVMQDRQENYRCHRRPAVTLSFAQSLDGSIALEPTSPVKLSNGSTQIVTHHLRSIHDGILIGIGTLLADDPLLTVRYVPGQNPQPIVVDSHLRFPLQSRLMRYNTRKPWVATTRPVDSLLTRNIEEAGGKVMELGSWENGWVDLHALLQKLYDDGIRSVMVEGGSRIITSFLKARLADQMVVTVAPLILGGLRGVADIENLPLPAFKDIDKLEYELLQDNLLLWGEFSRVVL